jgi:uncharacterized protein YjbI with pentapeptide repeats
VASDEHLTRLREGAAVWNKWREGNPDITPNLNDAFLSGANLSGTNLSHADLEGASLHGANLGYAYLLEANVHGANLRYAYLIGANLHGANLGGAKFSRTILGNVDPTETVGLRRSRPQSAETVLVGGEL